MQLESHVVLNNSGFAAGIEGIWQHSFLPIQVRSLIVPSFYLPIFLTRNAFLCHALSQKLLKHPPSQSPVPVPK